MPLLLYCVASETARDTKVLGVGGEPVRSKVGDGLKFFYSENESASLTSHDVVAAAQAVHAVVSDVFSRGGALPFQYPTVVADYAEVAKLAHERGAAFRNFLERIGSRVQMEIRLTLGPDEVSNQTKNTSVAGSGTAYLKERADRQALLSAAAETCRLAAGSNEFRVRAKGENYRCQVLIERVEVVSFLERMRTLELPAGVRVAISGPWPPAGFWDEPR